MTVISKLTGADQLPPRTGVNSTGGSGSFDVSRGLISCAPGCQKSKAVRNSVPNSQIPFAWIRLFGQATLATASTTFGMKWCSIDLKTYYGLYVCMSYTYYIYTVYYSIHNIIHINSYSDTSISDRGRTQVLTLGGSGPPKKSSSECAKLHFAPRAPWQCAKLAEAIVQDQR